MPDSPSPSPSPSPSRSQPAAWRTAPALDAASARAVSAARSAQISAVGTSFLALRPLLVGPMMAIVLGLVAWGGAPGAQVAGLSTGFGVMLTFFSYEAWQARSRTVSERQLERSLLFTVVGIEFGCAATGGLGSPLLPMLFAPTVTAIAAFGRRRETGVMLSFALAMALALALVPHGTPFPPVPRLQHRIIALLAVADALLLLRVSVAGLSDAHTSATLLLADLREQALEQAQERARTLEALGARVAHEVKNPLSSVRGLIELMAEEAATRPGAERDLRRLSVAGSEVGRIEEILAGHLSFSRPLERLRPSCVSLRNLSLDVAELLGARAARAGVTIGVEGPAAQATVDGTRLKEALLNLAANAIEATPPGGSVTIELGAAEDAAGHEITVRDTGRGMGAEELARLGTPFFTTRAAGTGLGVVLARAAVEQHGGTLTFESAPSRGTTATILLPARPARPAGTDHGEDPAG
jgi:signal transduction histidine kinase